MKPFPWLPAISCAKVLGTAVFGAAVFAAALLVPAFASRVQATEVRIELSSGEVVGGRWAGSTGSSVRLEDGSSLREFPVDQVVALTLAASQESSTGPTINVSLTNGSSIFAQDVSMDDTTVIIEPRRQSEIRVPIDQVRSIRFRLGAPATDPQWFGLEDKELRSDLMVIRRGNDQLDPIEGVVVGLDPQNLLFELDGDPIEAPRDRLEGVLLRSAAASNARAAVKISDIYGSTFLTARLEQSDATDAIEILLPGQVRHRIALDQIERITWSSGRVMLARETPASTRMSPLLQTKLPTNLVTDWFGPAAEGEDLVMVAGGNAEYRVEPGFQTLAGSVGRDTLVSAGGTVTVRVVVDGEVQWEQSLTDSNTKGFRVPVAGANRIRLETLAGGDGDVGDQVRFLKPRLMK
ncbi:NPCBM/NEW2 domain protein [Stieleria neptunia]|uniref:NPCBM/NEW2 domain protein n=1 Tax=Stieleria neptunia TaxID=2527979 RepID=A0A518HZC0_9BACT|nr:NPCBM/NEW2 domain-containing protein [Stieleria neptunia]QDV46192.1 NPCBM/NEW2 domain protein [Stieleria neptunia]